MKHNLEKAQSLLTTWGIDALMIDHPADIFFLTGVALSTGSLLIGQNECCLFVPPLDYHLAKHTNISSKITVVSLANTQLAALIKNRWNIIGFDLTHASYKKISTLETSITVKPLDGPLNKLREIKTAHEIHLCQKGAALASDGLDYLAKYVLKTGITEKELAGKLAAFLFENGADGLAFPIIAAFGENTAFPHSSPSDRALREGDPILMDFGVMVDHYHSDMTRMAVWKQGTEELNSLYLLVLEAMEKALSLCVPGTLISDVDNAARQHIIDAGYGDAFVHGLGHGVGLEIHEPPFISPFSSDSEKTLVPGMIITIEPGIYFPGKYGLRLEDMILITDSGYKNLTNRPLRKGIPILS